MALLGFERSSELADHPHTGRRERLRHPLRRYSAALAAVYLVACAAVVAGQRTPRLDVSAVVSEVGSYSLFAGLFCWMAWAPGRAGRRKALAMGGLWALASVAVALLTKYGQTVHFLSAGTAGQPHLYWGLLFCLPPLALLGLAARDAGLSRAGLALGQWRWHLLAGLVAAAIISAHFITTIKFSNVTGLSLKPPPYLVWSLSYELYQSLAEELFFRGLILRQAQRVYGLNFWQAAALATVANLVPFLLKANWGRPLDVAGLLIYVGMLSVAACFLYRRFRSVAPGFVANVVFSFISVLRG